MNFNLLKFQTKTIEALRVIAYGRLRLNGPRFEDWATYEKLGNPRSTPRLKESGRGKVAGERAEVEQGIARHLCNEGLATLIAGGAFDVIEQADGAHLVEFWLSNDRYGRPHELFHQVEKCESLVDNCCVPGMLAGTQFRLPQIYFAGAHPKNFLWEGEPANPPKPDGTGNPQHRFRILRQNPLPKAIALTQRSLDERLRKLEMAAAIA
jgi:hypothetical protein